VDPLGNRVCNSKHDDDGEERDDEKGAVVDDEGDDDNDEHLESLWHLLPSSPFREASCNGSFIASFNVRRRSEVVKNEGALLLDVASTPVMVAAVYCCCCKKPNN
jgi:hypothetical protein